MRNFQSTQAISFRQIVVSVVFLRFPGMLFSCGTTASSGSVLLLLVELAHYSPAVTSSTIIYSSFSCAAANVSTAQPHATPHRTQHTHYATTLRACRRETACPSHPTRPEATSTDACTLAFGSILYLIKV